MVLERIERGRVLLRRLDPVELCYQSTFPRFRQTASRVCGEELTTVVARRDSIGLVFRIPLLGLLARI